MSRLSRVFTALFPVWSVLAVVVALYRPAWFADVVTPGIVRGALSALMLSMGMTLTLSELRSAISKPGAIAVAFAGCYVLMPALALCLARAFGLDAHMTAGLVLLGCISGGQTSNLCTYIAGGDTALSVIMTAASTIAAPLMLPLLSLALLGQVVPVDAGLLARSTAQIVLAPILAGVLVNRVARGAVQRISALLPVFGIAMLAVLIVGPVARTAPLVLSSFATLAPPVILLHALGGLGGYVAQRLRRSSEAVARTTAFETGFKSPALSFVIATAAFPAAAALPSAVSIMVLAPLAALAASILGAFPASTQPPRKICGAIPYLGSAGDNRANQYKVGVFGRRAVVVGYNRLAAALGRARKRGGVVRVVRVALGDHTELQ